MSMVRMIVGGVDTHTDTHVAAVIDSNGGVLGIESFPADRGGFGSRRCSDGSHPGARLSGSVFRAPGRGVSALPGSSMTMRLLSLRWIA